MVGTAAVADTLPVADNLPHQEVADNHPAAAAGIVPAAPDGLDHASFHPDVPHTTLPHAFSQNDARPPASPGSLVPSRPAALLGTRRESVGRTAGAAAAGVAAAGRMRLELGAGRRTGVGLGHRAAVVAEVVGTAAAAGSCSLCFVEVRRRGVAVAGRRCICYRCHICCRCCICCRGPGRRMTASMTSHRGCTKVAVPVLGSCPAGHCQNIHSPVPAVHAITFVSIHS